MANNSEKVKGVSTLVNRKWDDAEYEQRARERKEHAELESGVRLTESVSARGSSDSLKLDSKVGSRVKFNAHPDAKRTGKGYWCQICEKEFLDSSSYLEHVNSRYHQNKLGKNMRITESSLSDVKSKLSALKRARTEDDGKEGVFKGKSAAEAYELRRSMHEEERREKKRQKREKKKDANRAAQSGKNVNVDVESVQAAPVDDKERIDETEDKMTKENDEEMEMMKLMGFGGFK